MDITTVVAGISVITSLASVLVAAAAVSQTRKSKLTAAYFDKMTEAYEHYLTSMVEFVYDPSPENRNRFYASVYTAVLYASKDAAKGIQVVHRKAVEYVASGMEDVTELNKFAGYLEEIFHEDLARFQQRAKQ